MSSKYQDQDEDEGSESDDGFMKPALYVQFPKDFDPNKAPCTGEEYLQHVIYERKRCKQWVTADIDKKKFESNQTFQLPLDETKSQSSRYAPTTEWQTTKLDQFEEFRNFVLHNNTGSLIVGNVSEPGLLAAITRDLQPPDYYTIASYSEDVKVTLIDVLADYLDGLETGASLHDNTGAWIYALLSMLVIPLTPHAHSCLRHMARACRRLRERLVEGSEWKEYTPLNLFICIIGRYFKQFDLADSQRSPGLSHDPIND